MKYMLLIHQGTTPTPYSPDEWERLSEDERNAIFSDYQAINQTPGVSPGVQLAPPETAIALAIAFGTYRLGHRLNLARFFSIVGALLMVFAAGLLVDAVQNLQELGWLPWATHPLWHTGSILNEDTAVGDLLHSFFGYAQSPTVLQVCVYVLYLAVALVAFFNLRRRFFGVPAAR
jgi:FTR1 family protein